MTDEIAQATLIRGGVDVSFIRVGRTSLSQASFTSYIKASYPVMFLLVFFLQGCATIKHGTTQDVNITTTPPGVTATINDESCETPCTLHVPRNARYVTLQKGSYQEEYSLDKKMYYVQTLLGNVVWLWGWMIGVTVDALSGGVYEIDPVNITIDKAGIAAFDRPAGEKTGDTSAEEKASDADIETARMNVLPAERRKSAWSFGVAGYRGSGAAGTISQISYEKMLTRLVALSVRIGYIDDRFDNGSFKDTSNGVGGEIGMRFYPGRRQLEGWYLGGGLGFWSVKGEWQDDVGTPFVTTGHGEATVADLNFQAGYKWFPKQDLFFVDPSLGLGLFLQSSATPDPFGPGGIYRGYIRAGLAAGMRW